MDVHGNLEIEMVKAITSAFNRHPMQVNQLYEADGEIIDLHNQNPQYLVAKTDGIQEEIRTGLYRDPYMIGWMAVTVTISDLAATGADLIGILVSLQLPRQLDAEWIKEFQKGINDACHTYSTYIIGGDTNFSQSLSVTATGIGTAAKPLLRKKIVPGDCIYVSGPLGIGNSYAYSVFFDASIISPYQPVARLKESRLIREFATACIDTSDGLFPALSILAELNHTGIDFYQPLQAYLCPVTLASYHKAGIPAWSYLAGPHGEYELLFAIPSVKQEAFEKACTATGCPPLLLGKATTGQTIQFISEGTAVSCMASEIANLFFEADGDIQRYFQLLMQKHRYWTNQNNAAIC